MEPHRPASWIPAALLAGGVYLVIGLLFGVMAGRAGSSAMRTAWRLSAWVASGAVYGVHILREQSLADRSPRATAMHAAAGAAVGAFGLAVAAGLHRLFVSSGADVRLFGLALVAWPVITFLPAFVVALGASLVLARVGRRA
jgi:hypothetical protein